MRQKRKVLLYTHALTGGGAERVWALLASGLANRGHDVLLVTDFEAPENNVFVDACVRRITLGGAHAKSIVRLASLIGKEKPDITISALSASNLKHVLAALLAKRLSQAVISYHGYASSEPKLLSQIGFAATCVMTRLAASTICVSDGLLDYVNKSLKADPKKTLRIYNPVDSGPLPPATSANELLARGPTALAAGRFVPYKQFPQLIRAFARVKRSDARITILGEGPERPLIEAEIARLGLQHRVTLAGYVREPWNYYAQATCFVLPSSQEPFGLVVAEALANGLAIVASDCDGPREILGDGEYGALYPKGDETALAHAIDAALADPGEPARRIERASLFSLEQGLDEYEILVERISQQGRKDAEPLFPVTSVAAFTTATPRKILIYMHALTGGGAERAFVLLASGLAKLGHDVTIAVDYESHDNDSYLSPDVKRIVFGRGHFKSIARLKNYLSAEKPDVSISALGGSNLKHAVSALISGRRDRAILTYHGFFASEPKLLSRISYAMTPLTNRITARTIAVSKVLRNSLIKRWRTDAEKTHLIYNPIAWGPRKNEPSAVELKARAPVILASGRLTPLKNFASLIRAFAMIKNPDARLVILGDGAERNNLQRQIDALGLSDRVAMPGYISEPWSAYEKATCLAVTSTSESFSMVVVEGLAHGLAIVSTDCFGPREILEDGRYGKIVALNDDAALAAALTATLQDPGDPAPRIARAHTFMPNLSVGRYEQLIADVCAEADAKSYKPAMAST